MARDELLVIDRTYELLKWFLGRLAKFLNPLRQRYSLSEPWECSVGEGDSTTQTQSMARAWRSSRLLPFRLNTWSGGITVPR